MGSFMIYFLYGSFLHIEDGFNWMISERRSRIVVKIVMIHFSLSEYDDGCIVFTHCVVIQCGVLDALVMDRSFHHIHLEEVWNLLYTSKYLNPRFIAIFQFY